MLHNYLAAAIRNLLRNRLYAAINVIGMAVGLAAAIIVALVIRNELTFEHFLPHYEQIYRIGAAYATAESAREEVDATLPDVAAWLRTTMSNSVQVVRLHVGSDHQIQVLGINTPGHVNWADPEFFSVMRFPSLAGNLDTALQHPDGIVLTRAAARRYFGRDDPIGQPLELDRQHVFRVTAIIEDLPANTHFDFEMVGSGLASFSALAALDRQPVSTKKPWDTHTYFRLKPGTSLADVQAALDGFILERRKAARAGGGMRIFLPVVPISAIHFLPQAAAAMKSRDRGVLTYGIAGVGALILVLAMINYVNLSTARATRRSVEVGVRKAVGATRGDLIVQFIGEGITYAAIAALIATAIVEVTLPALNSLTGTQLTFSYWRDPWILVAISVLVVVVGATSGAYPALILSSFKPVTALKGESQLAGGGIRQMLVALQFAVLIALIFAVMTIARQTLYAKQFVNRLDTADVVVIPDVCQGAAKDAFGAIPHVEAAACSESAPFGYVERRRFGTVRTDLKTFFRLEYVGPGFLELYGLRAVAGRLFSGTRARDTSSETGPAAFTPVIINQTAVRKFGFASATAAIGQSITVLSEGQPSEIIGVVTDSPLGSIRAPIEPTVFHVDEAASQMLSLKIDPAYESETLRAVDELVNRFQPSLPNQRFAAEQGVRGLYADVESDGLVFLACAVIALIIASLGLFGLSSFSAERRTKEIGIRKALGASSLDILRLLMWQLTKPVLWANLFAWPAAYFVMHRWLEGFANHVDLSVGTFLLAGGVALIIAWLTVLGHLARVARTRPVAALRYE